MSKLFVFLLALLISISLPTSFANAEGSGETMNLKDLGFAPEATRADPIQAQLLEQRAWQLQRHQIMGYTTAALILATVLAAPDNHESASPLHISLAAAAEASYAYTAYLSLTAPELPNGSEKTGWGAKIHKAMVWVHLPAMALLPVAGLVAQQARLRGEAPSGLGAAHKNLGEIALIAILVSTVSMTIEF